ncbi:MAG: hypothetical protein WKF94_12240 [Solirubrobacteraceae bacterium]
MARRDPRAFASFMTPGRSLPTRMLLRASAPALVRLAGVNRRATEAAARADVATLGGRLDQVETWIGEGVLNGPELNAADFQIGVSLSAMLRSDDAAPLIAGHIDAVLPPAWLPPLRHPARR